MEYFLIMIACFLQPESQIMRVDFFVYLFGTDMTDLAIPMLEVSGVLLNLERTLVRFLDVIVPSLV
jgi:hypothetical protein